MRRQSLIIVLSCLAVILLGVKPAQASILTIGKTGEVKLNVLSAQDSTTEGETIAVSKSSVDMGEADMPISLFRKDGKYILNVAGKDGEKNFDITDYKDNVLEIEDRPSVKKIGIGLSDNQFFIEQAGIKAKTLYQINIEPQKSRITILTPTGYKFLTVLPKDALDILLMSKSISSLGENGTISITEDSEGNLFYEVAGIKRIGVKDVYMYDAPVSAKISATSGEVLEVNQPIWLKILSLFTLQT
jgi:hypothetical protein